MNRNSPLLLQLIVLVIPLLFPSTSRGEILPLNNPLVRQIPFPAGDPGTVAWNVAWDASGVAYVGRDRLWRWDGTEWTVHGPETLRELRGMHFGPDGRLWLGGFNSLGYFDPVTLQYSSVLDWLPEEHRILNEVWEVHHDGEFLWVGTAHKLYRLNAGTFKVWEFSSHHRVVFHFVGDEVFAHVPMEGLFQIQSNGRNILYDLSSLGENAIMMLGEKSPTTLFGVSGDGYFEIEKAERKLSRIVPQQLDGLSAVDYSNSIGFVCGTIRRGIKFFGSFEFINIGYGVQFRLDENDSSVIKVVFESENELWILSTGGVYTVHFDIPIQEIEKIGTGIVCVTQYLEDKVFIGARDGVFSVNLQGNEIEEIQSTEVRKMQPVAEGVVFNDYDQIVSFDGVNFDELLDIEKEIWNFHVVESGYIYISYQDRIATYRNMGEGAWELLGEHEVEGPLNVLEEDESGTIWGCVENGPLYELRMDTEAGQVLITRMSEVLGRSLVGAQYRMEVIDRGPVLIFPDQLIRWDPVKKCWEAGDLLEIDRMPLGQAFTSGTSKAEGWITYSGSGGEGPLLAHVEWDEAGEFQFKMIPWIDMTGIGKVHKMEYLDGETPRLVFMGMKGVMLADPELSKDLPLPRKPVIWDAYTDRPASPNVELDYGDRGLRFKFSSPGTSLYYPVRYQTRIRGLESDWTDASGFTDREIGQLLGGSYVFEVIAVDPIGRVSEASFVQLMVYPPWYRTTLAYGAGLLFLILLGYGGARIWVYRVRIRQVELESLVEERTGELRRANSFKDDFIANMSHEIRNPLNGVIGLIGQLREGESPSSRNLHALRSAARYLRTTVEAVLDFAKLESGTVSLEENEFDLMEIAGGVLQIYRDQADRKGLELISCFRFPEGVRICADERKLHQILGNLTSNAVKFTQEGSVVVILELSGEPADSTLCISVKDTGCGIPDVQQDLVFEKFQQCKTGDLKPSGTGLGLAIVRSFADTMGGTLTMDSAEGRGTTMEVCLPVKVVTEDQRSDGNITPALSQQEISVLVVEDLEYNRAYLEDFLTSRGCHVTSAEDGLDGFNLARQGSFDLILIDWELPTMNGLEIAKRLREGKLVEDHVRIVGMTAFATVAVKDQCLEGGMNTFLTKPIDPSLLIAELEAAGMANVPRARSDESAVADALEEGVILDTGILGEMTPAEEWVAQKARWLGIFNSHMEAVHACLEMGDLASLRKDAHKLLGHLRMLKMREIPESIMDLLTAAHTEDLQGASAEWKRFQEMLPGFLSEFDSLDLD